MGVEGEVAKEGDFSGREAGMGDAEVDGSGLGKAGHPDPVGAAEGDPVEVSDEEVLAVAFEGDQDGEGEPSKGGVEPPGSGLNQGGGERAGEVGEGGVGMKSPDSPAEVGRKGEGREVLWGCREGPVQVVSYQAPGNDVLFL